jgi:hypothetical protein
VQDAWVYGGHPSLVCSVLAYRVWQQGLGDALPGPVQATEQTPKGLVSVSVLWGECTN